MRHAAARYPRLVVTAAVVALLAACGASPEDAPVRTSSPSGSWTAPSAAQAADRNMALVRVVSAIPGASRLDVFIEGQKIADGLEYRTITPYREVASGRQGVRIRPAGLDTADPLAQQTHNLQTGRHYTIVMVPGAEGEAAAAVRVLDDPMTRPDEGQAALRIVHAGGDAGRVDVQVPGRQEPVASGLEFQGASDFVSVQPGAAQLELRPAGRTEIMHRVQDLGLDAGGIYTVVVIGRTRIEPPLDTLIIEDRLAPQ